MKTKFSFLAQFLLLCILFTMVVPPNASAADSLRFEMNQDYVNGNIYSSVRGVMANQGNYIAWGQYGNIQTSKDGINWTSGSNSWTNGSVSGNLYNIVYNDTEKKYVGIGKNCYSTSSDGKTWRSEASSENLNHNDLIYVQSNYYGISSGYGGLIQKSSDGKSWRTLTTGLPKSDTSSTNYYNLSGITYGNGQYIIVGSQGKVLSSNDGESWNVQTLGESNNYVNFIDVIYAGGQFIIVGSEGNIYTSNDGDSWVKQDSGKTLYEYNTLSAIGYDGGKYVVLGSSKNLTSTDGVNWQSTKTNSYGYSKKICFDTSGFVSTSGGIAYSNDGVSWTAAKKPTTSTISYISDLQFLNGQYVGVGYGFMTSSDGATWVRKNRTEDLNHISYGNGKYVGTSEFTKVKTSTDGVTWQEQTINLPGYWWLNDITYGNKKFVIVGNEGLIIYSSDGINWSKSDSGITSSLRSILYVDGSFIAVGESTILRSSDGVKWKTVSSGLINTNYISGLRDLAGGGGKIVAVGSYYKQGSSSWNGTYHGVILSSSDGFTWTEQTPPPTGALFGVSYGNGQFLATGDSGTVLSSKDGVSWTPQPSFTKGTLGMIASNGSGFVIGSIIESSDLLFRSTSTDNVPTPSGDWQNGFINEPVDKSWTIHFTQEIDPSTVNSSTVYVTAKNGTKIEQNFSYSSDNKSLTLSPQTNYTSGEEYDLNVTIQVKSATGTPLTRNVTMHFAVR